jgi:hypothetical protein
VSVDDIDARTTETLTFGLDGRTYEIDLSRRDAQALRETLAPYISAARRVRGRSRGGRGSAHPREPARGRAIREWARASGYDVSDRGRIATEIVEAYSNAPNS